MAWAGLVMGPAFWAMNMQLGLILPHAECGGGFRYSTLTTLLGAGLAILGAGLSYRASSFRGARGVHGFLGSAGTLAGLIFAFALLLQAASTLVLTGCER
ncbi:hypothetical protein D9599_26610 [Roseomonas sp. KE2513]|nr:hypothetical protein [Roseomonas sp. KE2513]